MVASSGSSPPLGPELRSRARELWRKRHLQVRSLPGHVRMLVVAALVMSAVGGILIVVVGQRWHLPGGRQPLVGTSIPRLIVPFCYLALGTCASSLAAAACRRSGVWRALTLVGVALFGAAVAASTVGAGRQIDLVHPPRLPFIAGWVGIFVAAAVPVAGFFSPRERSWVVPILAALPFLLGLSVYASWRGPTFVAPGFPIPLQPRDVLGFELVTLLGTLQIGFVVLGLGVAVEAAAAARDLAAGAARILRPFPEFVGTLLIGKLAWVSLGYARMLPKSLGGPHSAWLASRRNGPVAWTLAALLAGGAAWWAARRDRRPVAERGLRLPAWGIAAGLSFALGLIAVAFIGVVAFTVFSTNRPLRWFSSFADALIRANAPLWSVVGTVALALVAGVLLLRSRRDRSPALFLLVFAAWGLPRAVSLTWRLANGGSAPFRSIDLLTLDAVVSTAVAVLAVLWWLGVQRGIDPISLFLVLAVSTLLAHPSSALPGGWKRGVLFYLALVFPLAYQFLADSESLNQPGEGRDPRVLSVVGLASLPFTITVLFVALGFVRPGASGPLQGFVTGVASLFLAVPFAAMLVAARITDPERPL